VSTKTELTGVLEAHADSIRLASTLRVLARAADLHVSFKTVIDVSSQNQVGFQKTLQLLADRPKLLHSVDQLYLTIVRAAITETLDLTRDYCRSTGQTKILKAQPWFQIFRIFRNALNHNFLIEFKEEDQKMLPVEWSGLRIDASHEEMQLTLEILPLAKALEWLEELERFISTNIR
jgi:hypothetical protein